MRRRSRRCKRPKTISKNTCANFRAGRDEAGTGYPGRLFPAIFRAQYSSRRRVIAPISLVYINVPVSPVLNTRFLFHLEIRAISCHISPPSCISIDVARKPGGDATNGKELLKNDACGASGRVAYSRIREAGFPYHLRPQRRLGGKPGPDTGYLSPGPESD